MQQLTACINSRNHKRCAACRKDSMMPMMSQQPSTHQPMQQLVDPYACERFRVDPEENYPMHNQCTLGTTSADPFNSHDLLTQAAAPPTTTAAATAPYNLQQTARSVEIHTSCGSLHLQHIAPRLYTTRRVSYCFGQTSSRQTLPHRTAQSQHPM
jgi:hypothetical protein